MAEAGKRPLSPHLQVYKWGPHMLVSILGRATGDVMGTVGALILLAWLGSAVAGAETYTAFMGHAGARYGQVVLIGMTYVFLQHAATGMRHLVLDTGAGYALSTNRTWAIAVVAIPLLLTAAIWLYIYYGKLLHG
ncbi:MAG: succinate dehydrogenase, cytochrome b556 subunit [Sphingopyxis sp.]|nr:succinate dehydrogenase, cytochrome b556 subunit [Sphingopyxis sp.]